MFVLKNESSFDKSTAAVFQSSLFSNSLSKSKRFVALALALAVFVPKTGLEPART